MSSYTVYVMFMCCFIRWVKNLETAFTIAWDLYESGQPPNHIQVPDCLASHTY